jgi:hypothetical protein
VPSSQHSVEFIESDSHHEVATDDTAAHSTLRKKGEAAEHLSFGEVAPIAQRSADPIREVFVVRHGHRGVSYRAPAICLP